ncbi:hypothetical protein ACFX5D_02055 [Flavobacterium sp. LB3P45]|uniref:SdpI/YhfL protein family protein n=1 Tax=Flavobacterium fructosi TaxID=3230416 RepID=A0ABW6HIA0_9FLAO
MKRITIVKGDWIRPEIRDATLKNMKVGGTQTDLDEVGVWKKFSLSVGAIWLIFALIFTVFEPNNIFFTMFLGLGIFFGAYTLQKTQKLL